MVAAASAARLRSSLLTVTDLSPALIVIVVLSSFVITSLRQFVNFTGARLDCREPRSGVEVRWKRTETVNS